MSNMKLALLVISAFILVLVFGHNPADEMRKRRDERKGRKLVEKIEEANKKKASNMPFYNFPQNAAGGMPANRGNINGQWQQPANPYYQQQNQQNQNMMPPAQGSNPPADTYYPPEPKKNVKPPFSAVQGDKAAKTAKNDDRAAKIVRKTLGNDNLMTDDGKNLAFWGQKVYVYDDQGKLKPMPDGNYPMYDGKWTMVVRGGEQVVENRDIQLW